MTPGICASVCATNEVVARHRRSGKQRFQVLLLRCEGGVDGLAAALADGGKVLGTARALEEQAEFFATRHLENRLVIGSSRAAVPDIDAAARLSRDGDNRGEQHRDGPGQRTAD